jgi:hypothetical protein
MLALAGCSEGSDDKAEPAGQEQTAPIAADPAAPAAAASQNTVPAGSPERSAYTRVDLDACKLVSRVEEGASASWTCPGHGGIDLVALTGDGRMDLDAGRDNGTFESLTPFNDIGDTVEWRLGQDGKPIAMIYRLRTATPEVEPRSVLFVETVPGGGKPGCLLARIEGSISDANQRARKAADAAEGGVDCGNVQPLLLGETG